MFARDLARVPRHRDRDAVPADDVRGGRPPLRVGQAGHAVRARDRGRDRSDARLGVRRLRRAPRPCGSCASRRTFSRAELAALEEVAKEWGAKGLAYLVRDEEGEVRSPIAKFLSEEELAALGGEPGGDAALRRRHVGDDLARARRTSGSTSAASSA